MKLYQNITIKKQLKNKINKLKNKIKENIKNLPKMSII